MRIAWRHVAPSEEPKSGGGDEELGLLSDEQSI